MLSCFEFIHFFLILHYLFTKYLNSIGIQLEYLKYCRFVPKVLTNYLYKFPSNKLVQTRRCLKYDPSMRYQFLWMEPNLHNLTPKCNSLKRDKMEYSSGD